MAFISRHLSKNIHPRHCNSFLFSSHHTKSLRVEPYLCFLGNCEEALDFYVKVFDGTKEFVNLYKDSPVPVPEDYKHKIIHASMTFHDGNPENKTTIMLSDIFPGKFPNHTVGSNIHLSISMNDYQRLEAIFNRFAATPKTQVSMPLGKQFWGAIFGSLVDPFGVNWMFSSDAQDKKN